MEINLIKDQWLSQILGKECLNIEGNLEHLNSKLLENKNTLIYTKISYKESNKYSSMLLKLNFNLIEKNLIYENNNIKSKKILNSSRFTNENDMSEVLKIAEKSFKYDRFHQDILISDKLASKIKVKWVESYFKKERGDFIIVSEYEKKIVGFLLILVIDNIHTIDLIAVDPEYHNKGIARDMILFYFASLSDNAKMIVGTQNTNLKSIKLYESLKFKLVTSKYIWHRHN